MRPIGLPRCLGVAQLPASDLCSASSAVEIEYLAATRTVRLRCCAVEQIDGPLYRLRVDPSAKFDWPWEGACVEGSQAPGWSGDVVEVDQDHGDIYVKVDVAIKPPGPGDFLVKPFGFLKDLNTLFNKASEEPDDTNAKLRSAVHLGLAGAVGALVPAQVQTNELPDGLGENWGRSWSILWGPPGTGKTSRIGADVASALDVLTERILVVSTTNKATDGVAIAIGKALVGSRHALDSVARVGTGSNLDEFRKCGVSGIEAMLTHGEVWLRECLSKLTERQVQSQDAEESARIKMEINEIRAKLAPASQLFVDSRTRVVVTTAFAAIHFAASQVARSFLDEGTAPFSTVIIDEAGLLSRPAVAALSCLAARRVVLVGDPRQLSPISRMSRVLASDEARWLAESALAHLEMAPEPSAGVTCLLEQHRMHADIRNAVSEYQYGGRLYDGQELADRSFAVDPRLHMMKRAIWYVLDQHPGIGRPAIRPSRGSGNRSWVREGTLSVVKSIFDAHPLMKQAKGLYLSPFVAQTRALAKFFDEHSIPEWRASTTHRQQGMEADYVIFDTVSAGSTAWSHFEWKRLVNVGLSRAKHVLIVLASEHEMEQPYLCELKGLLQPMVLRGMGGHVGWHSVSIRSETAPLPSKHHAPTSLGAQFELRRAQRPILSHEQERLCAFKLDGRPRLVRGVAGSGKTEVLAKWLARMVQQASKGAKLAVVYNNVALHSLLAEKIDAACAAEGIERPLATGNPQVELIQMSTLLNQFESKYGLPKPQDIYDLEARSKSLLDLLKEEEKAITPIWDGVFIDEAQDMGHLTMELLARLVKRTDPDDTKSRAMMVFLDNAQNIYHRKPPRWPELGLNMQGRSVVMQESFRSTAPIVELAMNVRCVLEGDVPDEDFNELVQRGLLEKQSRNQKPWWHVRFNHVDGPVPELYQFKSRTARKPEYDALAKRVAYWIFDEHVRPCDIRILMGSKEQGKNLEPRIRECLVGKRLPNGSNVQIEVQASEQYCQEPNTLVITTAHSYKGYEAEIVAIPAIDCFQAKNRPCASALYVAMTRARSLLYLSGGMNQGAARTAGDRIMNAIQWAIEAINSPSDEPVRL